MFLLYQQHPGSHFESVCETVPVALVDARDRVFISSGDGCFVHVFHSGIRRGAGRVLGNTVAHRDVRRHFQVGHRHSASQSTILKIVINYKKRKHFFLIIFLLETH